MWGVACCLDACMMVDIWEVAGGTPETPPQKTATPTTVPTSTPMIRVRGSSNGLANHPGGDVYRGLLVHAGLLLFVVVVVGGGTHPKMNPK